MTSSSNANSTDYWLFAVEALEERLLLAADFNIVVQYPPPPAGEAYTTQQKAIINDAADRWEEVITGTKISNTGTHTLTLQADIDVIDGAGKTLAVGGYNSLSSADKLPVTGHFTFDKSDIDTTTSGLGFFTTIMHEIGHAIGVGTLWKAGGRDFVDGEGTNNPRFNGPAAIAAYKAALDPGASSVPIQIETGGDGYGGHWRENALESELMTPTLNTQAVNPLSKITVGSLSDLGYRVNLAAADNFGDGFAYVSISQQLNGGGFDSEQDEGTLSDPYFGFLVYRSGDTSGSTTITYEVDRSGLQSADANDFTDLTTLPATQTVTIDPGDTFEGLFLRVNGDLTPELDETFKVTILSVINDAGVNTQIAGRGADTAQGVIRTDDGVPATVTFDGTSEDDRIEFETTSEGYVVTINGEQSAVPDQVSSIVIRAFAGDDQITVNGSAADEKAIFKSGSIRFSKSGFNLKATSVETILVNAGTGNDVADLFDSAGNDKFVGRPLLATMQGSGYLFSAIDFDRVIAHASQGTDLASLHDSSGNDKFKGNMKSSRLFGNGFYNRADKFDLVKGFATTGTDIARLVDTSGNETFVGKAKLSQLKGSDFRLQVRTFDKVYARSTGGKDIAKLYGDSGKDKFYGYETKSKWVGSGFVYQVNGFDVVNAYSGSGSKDVAILRGSAEADKFVGRQSEGKLFNSNFLLFTNKFDTVKADGKAGIDILDARLVNYRLRPTNFEDIKSNT
jgi:hypothetical protein